MPSANIPETCQLLDLIFSSCPTRKRAIARRLSKQWVMATKRPMIPPSPRDRSSATIQVLHTYELLELIITFLPVRRILITQRVSKAWRAVVGRSLRIRQLLYLEPTDAPLIPRHVAPVISRQVPMPRADWADQQYVQELCFNPSMKGLVNVQPVSGNVNASDIALSMAWYFPRISFLDKEVPSTRGKGFQGKRSYDQMFITEPPCTAGTVTVFDTLAAGPQMIVTPVQRREGLRFGDLAEAAAMLLKTAQAHVAVPYMNERHQLGIIFWMPATPESRAGWNRKWAKVSKGEGFTGKLRVGVVKLGLWAYRSCHGDS